MSGPTREARDEELARVWPAAAAAHLFAEREELEAYSLEAPWRVRVTSEGDAVVLGRWRAHLGLLAIRGIWCPDRRIPAVVRDLTDVAYRHGFERLLGPLLEEEAAQPYLIAGMTVAHRVVAFRRQGRATAEPAVPGGIVLREGGPEDADDVLALDAACFEEFWRADRPGLTTELRGGRLALAESEDRPIGYTLCTVRGGEATIARLAVDPAHQRRGVGGALLREAIAHVAAQGARAISLCTQEENEVSRRLYGREGFRGPAGRLVSTISPPRA